MHRQREEKRGKKTKRRRERKKEGEKKRRDIFLKKTKATQKIGTNGSVK